MVHSAGGAPWSARLVGFEARADGEIDTVDLGIEAVSAAPGVAQRIDAGSCVVIDAGPGAYDPAAGVCCELRIWCRRAPRREATLMGRWHDADRAGFALALRPDMRLIWRLGDGSREWELAADEPLEVGAWHAAQAEWEPDGGRASVRSTVLASGGNVHGYVHLGASERAVRADAQVAPVPPAACPLVVGAHVALDTEGRRRFGGHFTGKVDGPSIAIGGELTGAWDLGAGGGVGGAPGDRVPDLTGQGPDAKLRNCPARCVTGAAWSGRETDYRVAPAEYAALHLHEHDLADAEWEPGLVWGVPTDLPSGVYGMQLRSERGDDCIPFVVRPWRSGPRAPIALVLPTATYMAYANDHMAVDAAGAELALAHVPVLEDAHRFLAEHREYGLALYDQHVDGSAVMYSSRRRPVLSMRHSFCSSSSGRTWGLKADLQLVDWLTRSGYAFDVVTDEDVDREGAALLEPYAAVLTGAHPEYVSTRMADAFEGYVSTGGRMLYLGGNGFWWVTAFHPKQPHLIEVRRGEGGAQWDVAPGSLATASRGSLVGSGASAGDPRSGSSASDTRRAASTALHRIAAGRQAAPLSVKDCSPASRARSSVTLAPQAVVPRDWSWTAQTCRPARRATPLCWPRAKGIRVSTSGSPKTPSRRRATRPGGSIHGSGPTSCGSICPGVEACSRRARSHGSAASATRAARTTSPGSREML